MNDHFNVETLRAIDQVLMDDFMGVVEGYLNKGDVYIRMINEGLEAENYEAMARAAHPLKSSSAMLGIVRVSEIAKEIEQLSALNQSANKERLSDFVAQLKSAWLDAQRYLKTYIQEQDI